MWSLLENCGLRIFCLAWMPVELSRGFLWFVLVFYALARVLANMEGMECPSSDRSAGPWVIDLNLRARNLPCSHGRDVVDASLM